MPKTLLIRELKPDFPKLESSKWEPTSPKNTGYNCIAWAAADLTRWWEPAPFCFWPKGAPENISRKALIAVFSDLGYEECSNSRLENGYEKIALYEKSTDALQVTHAARQLPSGLWASKLGQNVDIEHELNALDGPAYGRPRIFMKRLRKD